MDWPERFVSKVKIGEIDECWPWIAANNGGYGRFRCGEDKRLEYTHRLVYLWEYGILPLVVRHKCDNPPCCNPRHLIGGTHADNSRDIVDRNRWTSRYHPRGEAHYKTTLMNDQVLSIRQDNRLLRIIAAEYGVSVPAIHAIKKRRHWKHLE